jgi:hypothetical protein
VFAGAWRYAREFAAEMLILFLVVFLGFRRGSRGVAPVTALAVTITLMGFFAPFSSEEPARRLAPIVPAWGVALGIAWDRLRLRPLVAEILVAAAIPLGIYWLLTLEGGYYETRFGLFFFPHILWIRLASRGAPAWLSLGPALGLVGVSALALQRVLAGLRES